MYEEENSRSTSECESESWENVCSKHKRNERRLTRITTMKTQMTKKERKRSKEREKIRIKKMRIVTRTLTTKSEENEIVECENWLVQQRAETPFLLSKQQYAHANYSCKTCHVNDNAKLLSHFLFPTISPPLVVVVVVRTVRCTTLTKRYNRDKAYHEHRRMIFEPTKKYTHTPNVNTKSTLWEPKKTTSTQKIYE